MVLFDKFVKFYNYIVVKLMLSHFIQNNFKVYI